MNRALRNLLCRLLIVATAWTPFHMANAAMLGTDQAMAPAAQDERARVQSILERSDVATRLQAFGIDPAKAKERVQAMTDEEVGTLAQKIDSLPAAGIDGGGLLILILVAALIWWLVTSPSMRR